MESPPLTSSQNNTIDESSDQILVPVVGLTPRRVKVYLLQGEDWLDNGTGYCVGEIDETSKSPYFLVRNEKDPQDIILKSFLEGSIQYQRQQETLIVWTDLNGKDLALSFQEIEGCADLCEFIIKVQQESYSPDISLYYVIPSLTEGEDITELITGPVIYPIEPTTTNLESILENLNQSSSYQFKRFKISKYIIDNDYFSKLVTAFEESELSKNLINLYTLSEIIKTLILYNETTLIEDLLSSDEKIFALSGILEYDPEYPNFKACHREFLKNKSFKTIIPVDKLKIFKKDFHLNYLKDVVLARFLDDQTFNLLSSLIYINQVEVINYLKDASILETLFKIYNEDDEINLKRDGVRMLHQYVLIAKGLQTFQRSEFFSMLVKSGLFKMISFALKDSENSIRVLGTELIVIIIEQDVSLVNSVDNEENIDNSDPPAGNHIINEEEKSIVATNDTKRLKLKLSDDMTLITILTKLLVEDKNPGLKVQAFEALRILLDANIATSTNPIHNNNNNNNHIPTDNDDEEENTNGIIEPDDFKDINIKNYFKAFYSEVAPKLFHNLIELASMSDDAIDSNVIESIRSNQLLYQHLCELISFCTKEHESHISRPFFLESNILLGLGKLIKINVKTILKLSAIRCLKSLILLNDNFYTRYIINNQILHYFFDYFEKIADQNNLANSTCLDFIELILKNCDESITIKRQNYKLLASYIYNDFKEFCGTKINHVSTGRELIDLVENGFYDDCNSSSMVNGTENTTKNDDMSFGSDEEFLNSHNASTPINEEDNDMIDSEESVLDKHTPTDIFEHTVVNGEKRPREDEEEDDESDSEVEVDQDQEQVIGNGKFKSETEEVITSSDESSDINSHKGKNGVTILTTTHKNHDNNNNNNTSNGGDEVEVKKSKSNGVQKRFSSASKKIALSLRNKNN
ncbi:component of IIS longevity pathway SMK-1-domain-containing protein [Scheffersomyces coipomensis]|uniref:component of IIS longevity pathway SMK-1-domain-containing protein n=1 Tax=Scheffersomyces coipomensis TaxID=1788519 RepID=UPI00315D3794